MRAGSLNRLVTVHGLPGANDDWGHPGGQRPNLGRLWANVGRLSGKALIRAGGLQAEVTTSIRVRYGAVGRLGLQQGMLLECAGATYEIRVILHDEDGREYVDLACSEVRNA
ncbi:phage head closure protein [Achromobacter insuavis]|uniref:phage head closure protein n=1 Tax=Achromobacter insuavis TaxID=1287735 RepID=UPI0015D40283